jgi:hypothetical protein
MSVLTHAPIPTTRPLPDAIPASNLTADQRQLVDDTLWHLGIEDGHVANGGGIPLIDLRLAYSATTAAAIGLHLRPGAELAQCHTCRAITSTDHAVECDDAAWRCTLDRRGPACATRYLDQH